MIPDHVQLLVFRHLSVQDWIHTQVVCRSFYQQAQDSMVKDAIFTLEKMQDTVHGRYLPLKDDRSIQALIHVVATLFLSNYQDRYTYWFEPDGFTWVSGYYAWFDVECKEHPVEIEVCVLKRLILTFVPDYRELLRRITDLGDLRTKDDAEERMRNRLGKKYAWTISRIQSTRTLEKVIKTCEERKRQHPYKEYEKI